MAYLLPPLSYSFDSLEPFYDKETLEIHYGKHHAGYVTKLNQALDFYPKLTERCIEDLLQNLYSLPSEIRTEVVNNGGGHANHSLFWRTMEPKHEKSTFGDFAQAIPHAFGSFNSFKEQFTSLSLNVFGSGWTWLSVGTNGEMVLSKTQNQDSPLSRGDKPILCLDLWEHAYYLKFKNRRIEWIESWWNLVNWNEVSSLYSKVKSGSSLSEIYNQESIPAYI